MSSPQSSSGSRHRSIPWHEIVLFIVVIVEWVYFYQTGTTTNRRGMVVGFGTEETQLNILRHSCETGLLALAMTPVILTGGIDLSVGSLLGLSAILFGKLWRDAGLPLPVAALCTLGFGALGGGLNASLITCLRLPPLIVTLGTYSLFRGLAEAITRGTDNFTNFPEWFHGLDQDFFGGLPVQAPIFLIAAVAICLFVHRTTFGRSFRAIGYSPEGARHAGLPVERRLAMVYILAGFVAALAGLILTARVNQAKADAGTGYELEAITAVVLGGTSIFGGSGSVIGTILGVAAIAVLRHGLASVMSNDAEEFSGMLTGALLLLALSAGTVPKILSKWRHRRQTDASQSPKPQSA